MILKKMMIFSLILVIYFIVNLSLLIKKKNKKFLDNFHFINLKIKIFSFQMIYSAGVIFFFIFFYVFFLKFLRIFRDSKFVDLKVYFDYLFFFYEYKLILIISIISFIFFFRTLRNFFILSLKFNFFKLNYYFQSHSEIYFSFYVELIYWYRTLWFFIVRGKKKFPYKNNILMSIYYFCKYIGYLTMFFCFFFDIFFHEFVLLWFFKMLPYYSFYQLFYRINIFFHYKIDLEYEIFTKTSLYIEYMHDKKLRRDYEKDGMNFYIGFDIYRDISINLLGDRPLEIDPLSEIEINTYLDTLFK